MAINKSGKGSQNNLEDKMQELAEELDSRSSERMSEVMRQNEEILREVAQLKETGEEARKSSIKEDIEEFREDFGEESLFLLETNEETRRELSEMSKDLNTTSSAIVSVLFNRAMSNLTGSKEDIVESLLYNGKIEEKTAKKHISDAKVDILSETSS